MKNMTEIEAHKLAEGCQYAQGMFHGSGTRDYKGNSWPSSNNLRPGIVVCMAPATLIRSDPLSSAQYNHKGERRLLLANAQRALPCNFPTGRDLHPDGSKCRIATTGVPEAEKAARRTQEELIYVSNLYTRFTPRTVAKLPSLERARG